MSIADPDNYETILHRVISSNGRLRVEQRATCHQATGIQYSLHFINNESAEVLATLPGSLWQGEYIMSGWDLILDFRYDTDREIRIGIDTRDLTYYFNPRDYAEPLTSLPAELNALKKRR